MEIFLLIIIILMLAGKSDSSNKRGSCRHRPSPTTKRPTSRPPEGGTGEVKNKEM